MATLNATFSISSTDLFDSVNISKTATKALTIDGDNRQGLTVIKTSTTLMGLKILTPLQTFLLQTMEVQLLQH